MSRYPSRKKLRSRFHKKTAQALGDPKFAEGSVIGDFNVLRHMGHSDVNKRNNHIMAKPQHWYRCLCSCGTEESRTQQELIDVRRNQCCFKCREQHGEVNEDSS